MSEPTPEEIHHSFQELRHSISGLLDRAVDFSATDSLEKKVKDVTSSLVKISQFVDKTKTQKSERVEIEREIGNLEAELRVQRRLLTICEDALVRK